MTPILDLYLQQVQKYYSLQVSLHTYLETVVRPISINKFGYNFVPLQSSILEEIKNWPKDAPPIPPSGWVKPRKGVIEVQDEIWEFSFHGAGLSFVHTKTHQDVSIEYTTSGELDITKWTLLEYLETLPSKELQKQSLLRQHPDLFDQLLTKRISRRGCTIITF